VTERPILFSAAMVNAILAGTKTQTRRVVDIRDHEKTTSILWAANAPTLPSGKYTGWVRDCDAPLYLPLKCPYGMPGNRLWVKEAIRHVGGGCSEYIADRTPTVADAWPWKPKALPGMSCPRGLSRITLEVTDVRVERVQDISEADALGEGISGPHDVGYPAFRIPDDSKPRYSRAAAAFESLWDSINGKREGCSWKANPWVWVVAFKMVQTESARHGFEVEVHRG
jgi:hypothetical protein